MTDKQFATQFSYVLAALIAIAFLCYIGANMLAPDYQEFSATVVAAAAGCSGSAAISLVFT